MPAYSQRPPRLKVSALAAMANPSSQRIDVWHLLDDATKQLAAVHHAGLDTTLEEDRVRRQLDRLAAYEGFWLYPGLERLNRLREHLDVMDTAELAEQAALAARLLEEYGDRAALFDDDEPLEEQELIARASQQQFYTVMLADDSPATSPEGLEGQLRALRQPGDEIQYGILRCTSVEDVLTAVALNGEVRRRSSARICRCDRGSARR